MLKSIVTKKAPRAIGPYSQGVSASGTMVFASGQLPVDPETGKLVEGDIGVLTSKVIDNLEAILEEAGCTLSNVVRVDVFLKDIKKDFAMMNSIYAQRFTGATLPARQTVQISELPMGSPIEISCIAVK